MKKLLESFKKLVVETQLEEYDQAGHITLYHYTSKVKDDKMVLEPEYFLTHGSSYSMREREVSRVPRVFFYPSTDPDKTERMIASNRNLFSVDVPIKMIYNLKRDPEGLIEQIAHPVFGLRKGVEWTELLNTIKEKYNGAFYSQPKGIDMIVWFNPIEVQKIERDK